MTSPHRRTLAAAVLGLAGCSLLGACATSTPAADTPASPATTTTGAAHDTTATPANPASSAATTSPAHDAATDACALVTEQEVTTAIGTDPGHGTPISSHGSSQCQYGTFQSSFVLVNLTPSRGKAAYDLMHNNPKVADAGTVADVTGLADRAFGISGHGTVSIYFNKGDALVLVMVEIHTATAPPKAQALALASTAASRV
jgi:hypothetical protein